jgi:acetolactate synthase I/II/III large subunit
MSTNKLNGAQIIVDYLIRQKVPSVFGLCGHGNIQFIDALYERKNDIKTVSVRHESVAGFMADVYYRVSGQPTATFTSCGPGSANLPISLANAFLDSVPFMAVTGNVPTSQFNRGAFQELYRHYQADFPSTVRSYCKRVSQPTRGEMVPLAVRQAWKTMVTGRPGPWCLTCRSMCSWKKPPRRRQTGRMERQHFEPLRRRSGRGGEDCRYAPFRRAARDYCRAGRALGRRLH